MLAKVFQHIYLDRLFYLTVFIGSLECLLTSRARHTILGILHHEYSFVPQNNPVQRLSTVKVQVD